MTFIYIIETVAINILRKKCGGITSPNTYALSVRDNHIVGFLMLNIILNCFEKKGKSNRRLQLLLQV